MSNSGTSLPNRKTEDSVPLSVSYPSFSLSLLDVWWAVFPEPVDRVKRSDGPEKDPEECGRDLETVNDPSG